MVSVYSQVNQTQRKSEQGHCCDCSLASQLELDPPGKQDLFQLDSLRFTGLIEWPTHGHRHGLNSLPE